LFTKSKNNTMKKFTKQNLSSVKRILAAIFFVAAFSTAALAQNGCDLTGPAGGTQANAATREYTAHPGVASSFVWTITNSGGGNASIVSITTNPAGLVSKATVNPGTTGGSYLLKAVVTGLSNPTDVQECTRSVSVTR
jgi:hypothetical protein